MSKDNTDVLHQILSELKEIKTILNSRSNSNATKKSVSLRINGKSSIIRTPDFDENLPMEFGVFDNES